MSSVKQNKQVYIPMCADIVHPGHLAIIKKGASLGDVTIGLLVDAAVASKKRLPFMTYEQRYEVVDNIKGVHQVVPQQTSDYRPNLQALKPDYVVHGNDWTKHAKQQVLDTIRPWGGQLVELEYTEGISSTLLQSRIAANGITPALRVHQLDQLLHAKPLVRGLEAHNGLSGLVVENARRKDDKGKNEQFDAIWISSLTDSIAKGKPDNEVVDKSSRLATINEILEVTTKPLIVDADTGGHKIQFRHMVRSLERLGVSAVVIEDKRGLKQNSLHTATHVHEQEDVEVFCTKIAAGLDARVTESFMIIARIESLILGMGQADALARAEAYIAAGASAIMIHSKESTGEDVRAFALAYNLLEDRKPLMVVPTSYNTVNEEELIAWGVDIVVYANQLLRAAYPAMEQAAASILENHRSYETDVQGATVQQFLTLTSEG